MDNVSVKDFPVILNPLWDIAHNLRWVWHEPSRQLFAQVDAELWAATDGNPARLLRTIAPERLAQLAADEAFVGRLQQVHAQMQKYLTEPSWFQRVHPEAPADMCIAYFSPEFGLAKVVPQYSGGLGVLAGDHLKTASDLGLPLVGIGLFYRYGYFEQRLSYGLQQELYPSLDPHYMGLELCEGADITVDLGGQPLHAQVWKANVGRVSLYLLDTDVDSNPEELRGVTDRLYGGNHEHRLRQEILLGIGGVRALRRLGIRPTVFHTNEGHAGFLGLERLRELMTTSHQTLGQALELVRGSTVFTTHTPVPAGIDRFTRGDIEKYFSGWARECGVGLDELMSLGHFPGESSHAPFNMAVMGLKLAQYANGVSKLHGAVSREMFAGLWPGEPPAKAPIGHVTNGVHPETWTSSPMAGFFERNLGSGWPLANAAAWKVLTSADNAELWHLRNQARADLVAFVRDHLRHSCQLQGWTADLSWIDTVLDPEVLTVGFARRAATYKRLTLLLSQPDRFRRLLQGEDGRPVQFVFAGKAHPADTEGKYLIRSVAQFAYEQDVRHRITYLPDYNMQIAAALVQGVDVWLNTPRRPLEASGTSGEKAVLNGGLTLSVLDGWWDEMYDGHNGWAIGGRTNDESDEQTAEHLYRLLEGEIRDEFYELGHDGIPFRWVQRIKASLSTLGPQVSSARMLGDYVERLYLPAALDRSYQRVA